MRCSGSLATSGWKARPCRSSSYLARRPVTDLHGRHRLAVEVAAEDQRQRRGVHQVVQLQQQLVRLHELHVVERGIPEQVAVAQVEVHRRGRYLRENGGSHRARRSRRTGSRARRCRASAAAAASTIGRPFHRHLVDFPALQTHLRQLVETHVHRSHHAEPRSQPRLSITSRGGRRWRSRPRARRNLAPNASSR